MKKWEELIKLPAFRVCVILLVALFGWVFMNVFSATQQTRYETDMLRGTITNMEHDIREKDATIRSLQNEINGKNTEITSKNAEISLLISQNAQTSGELTESKRLLNVAMKYEERAAKGIDPMQAYKLLGDYDNTINVVRTITSIGVPVNDAETWNRGKNIYEWIGANFQYCADKGFCIDNNQCTQIQFFSPDELVFYSSANSKCGDCDDHAQLFAGMMYASGIPYEKVRVACGSADEIGHCWNEVNIGGVWYIIDSVCSHTEIGFWSYVMQKFGLTKPSPSAYPSGQYTNVKCFQKYSPIYWYDPNGYHLI